MNKQMQILSQRAGLSSLKRNGIYRAIPPVRYRHLAYKGCLYPMQWNTTGG